MTYPVLESSSFVFLLFAKSESYLFFYFSEKFSLTHHPNLDNHQTPARKRVADSKVLQSSLLEFFRTTTGTSTSTLYAEYSLYALICLICPYMPLYALYALIYPICLIYLICPYMPNMPLYALVCPNMPYMPNMFCMHNIR